VREESVLVKVMRAIITCVDYADFLRITLPRVRQHFEEVIVLTGLNDQETMRVAISDLPPIQSYSRRAYIRGVMADVWAMPESHADGAALNKGAAIDWVLKRVKECVSDWVCVLDADIYLPAEMDLSGIHRKHLYSPHRRMMIEPGPIPPENDWDALERGPEVRNGEYAGYFHLFHTDDLGSPPWYESPLWRTAQGCDTVFTMQWGPRFCRRLPFDVLHLGQPRVNWEGRVTPRWECNHGNDARRNQ